MLTILSLRGGGLYWIWECLEPLQKWYVSSGSMSWKVVQFLPGSLGCSLSYLIIVPWESEVPGEFMCRRSSQQTELEVSSILTTAALGSWAPRGTWMRQFVPVVPLRPRGSPFIFAHFHSASSCAHDPPALLTHSRHGQMWRLQPSTHVLSTSLCWALVRGSSLFRQRSSPSGHWLPQFLTVE